MADERLQVIIRKGVILRLLNGCYRDLRDFERPEVVSLFGDCPLRHLAMLATHMYLVDGESVNRDWFESS